MEDAIILKTDALLRVVTPPGQREALLDAFERSSASAKAFAAEHGIKYPTFAGWVQRRRRERAAAGGSPSEASGCGGQPLQGREAQNSAWIEAVVCSSSQVSSPAAGRQGLAVDLPGGARLTLRGEADAALAAALLLKLAGAERSAASPGPAALKPQPRPRHA